MLNLSEHLRLNSADLDINDALTQPVSVLLGVDDQTVAALDSIGVKTVFDLGSSRVFAEASSVVASATSVSGNLPSDLLKKSAHWTTPNDLPRLPLDSLQGISNTVAAALKSAMDVDNLRDFAYWPPRQVARQLVNGEVNPQSGNGEDPLSERLRPALGEYPTERVYYDKLVMLGMADSQNLSPLSGRLSLETGLQQAGFGEVAVGAMLTFSQSWFAQGITLGHMLHSLALAPGEATRIAVIDWSRRTSATASEDIAQSEQLDDATRHSRAISEVQNSVAREMQQGKSMSDGWSKSTSDAHGYSGSIGGGVAGVLGKVAAAIGFGGGGSNAHQESETTSSASSASWSVGTSSMAANLAQNVNDRTEQHATSVRNRRASAVREVSQAEHEQVSTRVVANYNHMHALTVQYYEVVQLYRVQVQLHRAQRVIFLPFDILDFSGNGAMDLVARYRGQLLAAAITPRAADLLRDEVGVVEIRGAVRVDTHIVLPAAPISGGTLAGSALNASAGAVASSTGASGSDAGTAEPTARTLTAIRPGDLAGTVPGNAKLVFISFEDLGVARVRFNQAGVSVGTVLAVPPNTDQVAPAAEMRLGSIESIDLASVDGNADNGTMTLHCEIDGQASAVPVQMSLRSGVHLQKVAFVTADPADRGTELLAHLQANRAYYTRAVLGSLDTANLAMFLSPFSWNGKPLVDQVEPVPVTVAGNYLVLRAPVDDKEPAGFGASGSNWKTVLHERGLTDENKNTRLIPIPTDGVFAEAVLGRSNSAEKLDITRFWNWQDSPIPLQPTEIAPISTESRATAENLTPGQLSAPVLNIANPTALPDPTGLSAIIGALGNGNMFRDMSGLAGTQATAQQASAGTLTAATEAGRIASENFKASTQQATEMGKAAVDLWKANASASSSRTVSEKGASLNKARDLDKRGVGQKNGGDAGAANGQTGTGSTAQNNGGTNAHPHTDRIRAERPRSQ